MDPLQSFSGEGSSWPGVLTVTDITCIIGEMLEAKTLQNIWVRGELTNYKQHNSGHHYFSLGDPDCQLQCVMWRTDARNLRFQPGNGIDVLAFGSVGVYQQGGRYQFYVRELALSGEGEKHLLVEAWKKDLEKEGYFDLERKRPLPLYPRKIAVVTSESGAALHDILTVLSRRYPVEIILSPTLVQGENAPRSIAGAVQRADGLADIIIVGRGGGSYEDLFPFNHPDVVRAIGQCITPVISAVGHQVDVTLSDLVADMRAPTPSAAAELAVPDRSELHKMLDQDRERLIAALFRMLERKERDLEDLKLRMQPRRILRRVDERRLEVSDLSERLARGVKTSLGTMRLEQGRMEAAMKERIRFCQEEVLTLSIRLPSRLLVRRVEEEKRVGHDLPKRLRNATFKRLEMERLVVTSLNATLEGKNPRHLLDRGYCFIERGGVPIISVRQISVGDSVTVHLNDGRSRMRVEEVKNDSEV